MIQGNLSPSELDLVNRALELAERERADIARLRKEVLDMRAAAFDAFKSGGFIDATLLAINAHKISKNLDRIEMMRTSNGDDEQ